MSYYGFQTIKEKAAEMGVTLSYAVECRRKFLSAEMKRLSDEIATFGTYQDPVGIEMMWRVFDKNYAAILKLRKDRYYLMSAFRNHMKGKTADDDITDDMIARARSHPIELIIEFTRGKARCINPNHDDRNPSMYHGTRTNTAQCPACGGKWDAIGAYMVITGMNFPEAVRKLQ